MAGLKSVKPNKQTLAGAAIEINPNDTQKHQRNIGRAYRLKLKLGKIDKDHPQRKRLELELRKRLTEIEIYELEKELK